MLIASAVAIYFRENKINYADYLNGIQIKYYVLFFFISSRSEQDIEIEEDDKDLAN